MKEVGLVLDRCFEEHDTGPYHAENATRIERLRGDPGIAEIAERCVRVGLEEASHEMLARVHEPSYISRVEAACGRGERFLDPDTAVCPESPRIARLAAGSVVALCREVARGRLRRGFAAVRPPGHHAERDRAMGFCLFNNVAIAARYLRDVEAVVRVLIVDWDVHHGNGTQHTFDRDGDVFYFSVHQSPLYPGTGMTFEKGSGPGYGTTVNVPLPPGAGDEEFLSALRNDLVQAVLSFRPGFVLVSAGFDAHAADPLAGLEVTTEAFAEATRIVRGIAERHADGRLVSVLEGGYHPDAFAASVATHLNALL
jgi:acetoin utilization deacetylase AcuC-like enzyme